MSIVTNLKQHKNILLVSLLNFFLIYLSVFNTSYGLFIDEFYYIACANRPAFGYVDHPPLAPFILTIFQFIFGSSIYALRFLPALIASAAVFMAGIITLRLGGGKYSQTLAAVSTACVTVLAAFAGFYSMNVFEPFLTLLLLYFIVRIIKEENYSHWIASGIVTGLGAMNKHTFIIIAGIFIISLLISGNHKALLNRWFLYSVIISFAIFLPHIIWQIAYGFPTLEFLRNITLEKNVYTPPLEFIKGQLMTMSPASLIIWGAGVIYSFFFTKDKSFRMISLFFLLSYLFFMFSGSSRFDRLAFAYPVIFIAGAVAWENIITRYNLKWLKGFLIILLVSGLALAFPVILPYFSYETVKAHTQFLGLNTEVERGKKPPLPQLLADRIGWKEKVDLVIAAFNSLPREERKRTIIAANNYGQAGAIEYYGADDNFPLVASGHNNYYLWSKGKLFDGTILQLGNEDRFEGLKNAFDSVIPFPGKFNNPYVSPHENNLKVFICRNPKYSIDQMLEEGRIYY